MSPHLLAPRLSASADDRWTAGDWTLGVVLPLVLLAVGVALYLRGRAALAEARRVRAGFGGPPGSLDVGTELGFGVQDNREQVLAARRLKLWGLLLVVVALLWTLVTLVVALL